MRKLLPLLLGLFGLIAGGGAGYVLRPHDSAPGPASEGLPDPSGQGDRHDDAKGGSAPHAASHGDAGDHAGGLEYVKLNNQFVVPVIEADQVTALVILSLTLEVANGAGERVFAAEPKLRDSFLQVLFDHANAGGFDGAFTQSGRMGHLRKALLEPARHILGDIVGDVLIVDIVRQDS